MRDKRNTRKGYNSQYLQYVELRQLDSHHIIINPGGHNYVWMRRNSTYSEKIQDRIKLITINQTNDINIVNITMMKEISERKISESYIFLS